MNSPKLHPKYNALGNNGRYFVVTGGRGSGKSFGACVFLVLLTMEEGHKILFCRWTMITASVSIIPEFIEKIELLGLTDQFKICLLYTSPSPRDGLLSRMPSSA